MNRICSYKNGNYTVYIDAKTGTKIRYNSLDYFEPENVESMDLKITNCCYGVSGKPCGMCHEKSTPDGKHGDIMNLKFIDTMLPYSEVALGGGDILTHPDLYPFLKKLKSKNIIASATFNQWSFMRNQDLIGKLVQDELIHGIGVSLNEPDGEFVNTIKKYPNAIIHVINGIVTIDQLRTLSGHNLKILVLGYKNFGRGQAFYLRFCSSIEALKLQFYDMLPEIVREGWFDCVSFDNLAIKQLKPERLMGDKEWQRTYMGDDGFASMYIDAVNMEYARSSISTERYPVEDDIKTMFDKVRSA